MRVSGDEITGFTRQFYSLLQAGIPIVNGLDILAGSSGALGDICDDLSGQVQSGQRLSRALSLYPEVFDEVYRGLVETGEESGQLTESFARLADWLEKEMAMRKKVVSTLTYPAVMLSVAVVGLALFINFFIPQLVPMFKDLGVDLPWPTRALLSLRYVAPVFLVLVIGSLVFWRSTRWYWKARLKERPELERKLARLTLNLPVLGPLLTQIIAARVMLALSALLETGLPINTAIVKCSVVAGNADMSYRLTRVAGVLSEGETLVHGLETWEVFPTMTIQMLAVGEETAQLSGCLKDMARSYTNDVDLALNTFATALEPLIVLGVGSMVGFLVIATILPTVKVLQAL